MGLDVEMFLEVMKMLNSLFDCGCEVSLDEENLSFSITGRDYADDTLNEQEFERGHPLETRYVERMYSCDPFEEMEDGSGLCFDSAAFNGMVTHIVHDNERLKKS